MTNHWPKIRRLQNSEQDIYKYVFESESAVAETVLYKYKTYNTRTVMCISTQSGCPIGCRFCGAGDSFVKSLNANEIVEQVEHLLNDQSIDPTSIKKLNILFMAMGEPMLNFKQVAKSIEILYDKYPNAKLCISSSGPRVSYESLYEISERIPTVGLQFSVHESTDEKRNQLIPFEQKLLLKEISAVGEAWNDRTGRKPFFNYCAHKDNSHDEDIDRLLELFNPDIWEATISVICEREEHVAAANDRQRYLATSLADRMEAKGFSIRVFDPSGQDDIGGGCGQLWYVQEWMNSHPNLAKPSAGRGLPIVHTPRQAHGL